MVDTNYLYKLISLIWSECQFPTTHTNKPTKNSHKFISKGNHTIDCVISRVSKRRILQYLVSMVQWVCLYQLYCFKEILCGL